MDCLQILKERKLKATPQRLAVLKYLNEHTHPTIDEIYEKISQDFPSVSLATVYKNLSALKDEGLVVEVNLSEKKMRYDIFIHPHIHVVCENCGKIQDIEYNSSLEIYKTQLEKQIGSEITNMDFLVRVKTCMNCE